MNRTWLYLSDPGPSHFTGTALEGLVHLRSPYPTGVGKVKRSDRPKTGGRWILLGILLGIFATVCY